MNRRGKPKPPLGTTPSFRGLVPTPNAVLGFPLGVDRETTSGEIVTYVDAVGASSDRVIVGTMGASHRGRPMRYAIVGLPANVTPAAGVERNDSACS